MSNQVPHPSQYVTPEPTAEEARPGRHRVLYWDGTRVLCRCWMPRDHRPPVEANPD